MKQFPIAATLAAALLLTACVGRPSRQLKVAEALALCDPDSALAVLAQVDTAVLSEANRTLYDLVAALIYEEKWYRRYADTASCLSTTGKGTLHVLEEDRTLMEERESEKWTFRREVVYQTADDQAFPDDSTLLRVYNYYERESLGGTSEDKEVLRRFGRICFVLSRHSGNTMPLLQPQKLFQLAIHCAEASGDHELAYRAYNRYADYLDIFYSNESMAQHWCLRHALEHYRQLPNQPSWLLMILNSYGRAFILRAPCDLHCFPALAHVASVMAQYCPDGPMPSEVYDSVFQCLDSIWALPHENFSYAMTSRSGQRQVQKEGPTHRNMKEVSVFVSIYEEAQRQHKEDETQHWQPSFASEMQKTEQSLDVDRDTYLAPGYAQKAAMLQRRLMTMVIIILALVVLALLLLLWILHYSVRRRHEAEQIVHQREAEQMAERLRQKDTMIAALRGHIIDKSEILEMLAPTEGKRTIINARNWREIEATLDTADNGFVSRLRSEYPSFDEDDIRLCMLARLRLSNNALSAIYSISVSAVQHRKQKLKKEGFGVNDPNVTLDQIIANF